MLYYYVFTLQPFWLGPRLARCAILARGVMDLGAHGPAEVPSEGFHPGQEIEIRRPHLAKN